MRVAGRFPPPATRSGSKGSSKRPSTWREEHLFNLACALRLYDAFEKEIASYDAQLLQELEALQPPQRHDEPVPPHPNPAKEKAIHRRGKQPARTTLWRFAGVDLTRIDGISAGIAQIVLTEVGSDLSVLPSEHHFVSWLRLCPRTSLQADLQCDLLSARRGADLDKEPVSLAQRAVAAGFVTSQPSERCVRLGGASACVPG